MGLGDNKAMQEALERLGVVNNATVYAVTHYSHNSNPLQETLERVQAEYGYIPTFDGMTIEI